eukprot:14882529-Alexandrium_andersonii.AAC.1
MPPSGVAVAEAPEVTATAATAVGHHAALWRLATRALEAYVVVPLAAAGTCAVMPAQEWKVVDLEEEEE